MKALRLGVIIVVLALIGLGLLCLRVVDEHSVGLRMRGTQVVAIETQPGLHVVPLGLHLVLLDLRTQVATLPGEPVKSGAGEDLLIDLSAQWRISNPARFAKGGASDEYGSQLLKNLLRARHAALLGHSSYENLARLDSSKLDETALAQIRTAADEAGIELQRVDLARVEPTDTLATQMRDAMVVSLPARARELQKQLEKQNADLRAAVEARRDEMLAHGAEQAGRIRGEGDAGAAAIYQTAFGKEPEFAAYFSSLQAYRKVLGRDGDLLVITPDGAFFRYLRNPEKP